MAYAVNYFRVTEQRRIREEKGDRPRMESERAGRGEHFVARILIFQYFPRGTCRDISNRKCGIPGYATAGGIKSYNRDRVIVGRLIISLARIRRKRKFVETRN